MSYRNPRKVKSKNWWLRHNKDPFTKKARNEGYRSRASFKLIEIQQKFQVIPEGGTILDLGCSPGGWSEVARQYAGSESTIIGVDRIRMIPLKGVSQILVDINSPQFIDTLKETLGDRVVDCIICDIAPDTIGHRKIDRLRMSNVIELVWSVIIDVLAPQGNLVMKIREGALDRQIQLDMKKSFARLKPFKPEASRNSSSELYLVGQDFSSGKGLS